VRRSFLTLSFLAAACSSGSGASDAGTDTPVGVSSNMCQVERPTGRLFQADVLVVFDRSESMGSGLGGTTRYGALSTALNDVANLYQGHLRFGLAAFPGRGCPSGCCVPNDPIVDLALDNAGAVKNGLASLAPMEGQTPTAAALRQSRLYFASRPVDNMNRYVLLVTDGWPTCDREGRPSGPPDAADGGTWSACEQAAEEASQLLAIGVRVIVLGLEPDGVNSSRTNCLDSLALAGGAARSPGHPSYYSAETFDDLQRTLEAIFGGVTRPSCLLRFMGSRPTSPIYVVKVYLDGQEIPRDRVTGWDFEPPSDVTQVRLFGEYCRRAQHFEFSTFEVRFTCPVI
jgi:hypothetical protein